jgi:hypothetical protein
MLDGRRRLVVSFGVVMRALVLVGLSLGAGCATTGTPEIQVSSPFSEELGRHFDDSVDYVEDADQLGGRVASDWRRQIAALSEHSDLIVQVRIETVNSGVDASGMANYRLTAVAAARPLRGRMPQDNRVDLRVSAGEVGYNTVHNNEQRLQAAERRFLLFVKWAEDGARVRARWHLTPQSRAVEARVRDAIGYLDPSPSR